MRDWMRRVALALALAAPVGCASGVGWGGAMMGGMMVGGVVLGRGMMHGAHRDDWNAADVERFQPERLLEQRDSLGLTETQVAGLQAIVEDRRAEGRDVGDAARSSFAILSPDQRRWVRAAAASGSHH